MLPYIILTDDFGNVYNLPQNLFLKKDSLKISSSMQNLMYTVGGKQTGDCFPVAKGLEIEGDLYADTVSAMNVILRALYLAVQKGGKLSIYSDAISRNIDVRFNSLSTDWKFWPRFVNISITFDCEFPFFEDITETTETKIFAGNDTFSITVSDCDYVIYPIIEIEADQSVNIPSIQIKNLNDGAIRCLYIDPNFVVGNILVIDSKEGTVKRNSNNSIQYFNPAVFPRLQPGVNVIDYEGAACTMRVKYKKVYIL